MDSATEIPRSYDVQNPAAPQMVWIDPAFMKEIRNQLKFSGLSTSGSDLVLSSRLDLFKGAQKRSNPPYQLDYLVVVDFEATCEANRRAGSYEQEIIEFPAVLICISSKTIVDHFHCFCRPVKNKVLSAYCQNLTGITQAVVDSAASFPQVLRQFHQWLNRHGLLTSTRWCIVNDGSFDVTLFMFNQCKICNIAVPYYYRFFIHLSKLFQWVYLSKDPTRHRAKLSEMLDHLGMEFEGKAHSGLADSQNIARICLTMLDDGVVFRPTDSIRPENISPEKPFCCIAKPVGKKVWATKHQSAMANLAIRYGVP